MTAPRETPTKATDLLTREEIRAFTEPSNAAGARAVLVTWAIIAAAFALLARFPHPLSFAAAVILLGGQQLALGVLMHEAAHGTLFRARAGNEVLADWLCARPVWADVARYRRHHLEHHKHAGTELDPDRTLALPSPVSRASLARKVARDLLGLSGLKRVAGLVLMDLELLGYTVAPDPKPLPRRRAIEHLRAGARNATGALLANLALFGVLAATGHAWVYGAWIAAYLTTYSLFLRVRSLAEHACTEPVRDPMRNTRTTRAGLFARLTVAPHAVNYHLEHHLLMTAPYFRLRALHRLLVDRGAIPAASLAPGYGAVLRLVTSPRAG
jgi:fatty acid desaturase